MVLDTLIELFERGACSARRDERNATMQSDEQDHNASVNPATQH
jgi:hypothetical protein